MAVLPEMPPFAPGCAVAAPHAPNVFAVPPFLPGRAGDVRGPDRKSSRVVADQVVEEAGKQLRELETRIKNARVTLLEESLLGLAVEAQTRAADAQKEIIEDLRGRLPKDPVLDDGDPILAQVKKFAEKRALVESLGFLRQDVVEGRIAVKQYLSIVRGIARTYFTQFTLPEMKTLFVMD
jgi:hypothetical protein